MILRLVDDVIKLHDVARDVEKDIGNGELSQDIRRCADQLNALVQQGLQHGQMEPMVQQST